MIHREAVDRWTVSRYPGPSQLTAPSRDEAIALAREYAIAARVDIWANDDSGHRRLETYRA